FPREDSVRRLRKARFRVRIVGGIYDDIIAQKIAHHLRHLLALVDHEAGKEPAARHVLAGTPREVLRHRVGEILRLIIHARGPERRPPEARSNPPEPPSRLPPP